MCVLQINSLVKMFKAGECRNICVVATDFIICLKWEFNIYLILLLYSCSHGYEEFECSLEIAFHALSSIFHVL